MPKIAIGEMLQGPQMKALAACVVVGVLIVGWMYMPASTGADVARYKELKKFLDDFRAARESKKDLAEFIPRAEKLKEEMVPKLKDEASTAYPVKQHLLWAVRDELPRMMSTRKLTEETPQEKAFAGQLKNAADKLGIK